MLENKTTPITFEKKIHQLEVQKKEKEKLLESLQLQILDALAVFDMAKFDKIGMELKAVLAMNYDEKIAALKVQKAMLHIPERDPDHQEDILSDNNHIQNIEDEEIIELIRRRKIKGWEMLEDKQYKMREEHFATSNIGREEEIDLPSAPEKPETPEQPEAPESAEKKNKKRPRINKELLLEEFNEAAKTRSKEKDQIKPIIIKKWLINEKLPLRNKNELKRIVLEQFKTKEELKNGSYEKFAKEYNADENNKYTITKSITGLIFSLGLKINSTGIKELREYLYGEELATEPIEKNKLHEIKHVLLEKFPTRKSLKTQTYKAFAKDYNEDEKNTKKITTDLFRLAKSLGFQGTEALKNDLYGEELPSEPIEKIKPEKNDLSEQPEAPVIPETLTTQKKPVASNKNESKEKGNKEITLKILQKLEKKGIFKPENDLGIGFSDFAKKRKSPEKLKDIEDDEYLKNNISKLIESPRSITKYLSCRVSKGIDKDYQKLLEKSIDKKYQQLLWKRYCLMAEGIKGNDRLREVNGYIRDKERELLKPYPELLDKYEKEYKEKVDKAKSKGNGTQLIHYNEKNGNQLLSEDLPINKGKGNLPSHEDLNDLLKSEKNDREIID